MLTKALISRYLLRTDVRPLCCVVCVFCGCVEPSGLGFPYIILYIHIIIYVPTWIRERELKSPKTFRIHRTTAMTTTPFKIDLMVPGMGMKPFTSHRRK